MHPFRSTTIGLVICVTSFSCTDETGTTARVGVRVDTIGGIPTVRNGSDGAWDSGEEWSIREDLRLGGPNAPIEEAFGSLLTGVSLGPQGQVYILDRQADEIRVFDRTGAYRFVFGGTGDGPGELRAPTAMGWDDSGQLWVPNAFDGRYTVFDSLGNLIKTTSSYGRRGVRGLLYHLHVDSLGLVDQFATASGVQLVRRDTAGNAMDTLMLIRYPRADEPSGEPLLSFMTSDTTSLALRRFLPQLKWVVAHDGSVWHARSDSLRLIHRSPDGDTLKVVQATHRRAAFSDAEGRMVEHARTDLDRKMEFAPQLIQAIYPLDDGHVMVQIPDEMNQPGTEMDVFDPEGIFLGSVRWPFPPHPRSLSALRGDTIYAVTIDSLDVPYVVRAIISRPEGIH